MKTPKEILEEYPNNREWFGRENSPLKQEIVKAMEFYADQFKPKWISGRFYVVENSQYEEGMINQLSNGFEAFEDAVKFLNSDYNKKWHPKSFIMNSVTPLPEIPEQ